MKPPQTVAAIVITSLLLLLFASSARGLDLIVDDDKVQCPAAQHMTIQAAVNAAAAVSGTHKIRICAGTYPENVLIGPDPDTRFEIFGDGADKVFVTGKADTPREGPIFDAFNVSLGVAIEKLTIDGGSVMTGNPIGIRYQQTTPGLLKDLAVLNVRDADGNGQSVGIYIRNTLNVPVAVRVENNLVGNWTRVGILGHGPGVNIEIQNNRIFGPVTPKVWAPNGVQVSRNAFGLVKGNEVRGAKIDIKPPNAGSGILLFCAKASTRVEGNKIFDSDTGVNLEDNAFAQIIGNEVSGSLYHAYPLLSGVGAFFKLPACELQPEQTGPGTTERNLLEGNKASMNGRDGVHLEGFFADPGPDSVPVPSGNQVLNTDIKTSIENGIGVVRNADQVQSSPNRFSNNTMEGSGRFDASEHDEDGNPMPTQNIWTDNICNTPDPKKENQTGLCKR